MASVKQKALPEFEATTRELFETLESQEQPKLTLGIETSCDETSVAVLSGERVVMANVISSSASLHEKYGGIVPDIASRAHVQAINPAIAEALSRAEVTAWDLSAIAVTSGPGLVASLVVGVAAAKTLASVLECPLVDVNHLEAHIYANLLDHPNFGPPAVGLVVSGGHTLLVHMQAHGVYDILGSTLDDAAGEAFDKIGRFLGLGFPGGPAIELAALKGDPRAIPFPRAVTDGSYDFSFSGLKTAVINFVGKERAQGREPVLENLCASFQEAVVDALAAKTIKAAKELRLTYVFLSGGVAANARLRELMTAKCSEAGMKLFYPAPTYCTDNAAMVACCGFHRFRRGIRSGIDLEADPNLPLA